MMLLLALLGLVSAGNDESKCAMDFLNGETNDYGKCEMEDEIDSLIGQSQECWKALGKCQGGGGGGGAAPMGAVIKYNDEAFPFGLSSKFPLGAAYDEIHKRAMENFNMDEDHELVFDYMNENPRFYGRVDNDDSLESALLIAQRMGFRLVLNAHKTTLSPTPEPTEPWGQSRTIKQKYGSVADGRDSGIPNDRIMDFQKISEQTNLRLHYEDNIRVYNHGGVCYWEFYVDGARLPGGNTKIIRGGMHSHGHSNNDHQTSSIIGVAPRIAGHNVWKKGKHNFRIQLSGNGRDCYTGWDPESKGIFLMEVREVMQNRNGYHSLTNYGNVRGEDNMYPITGRSLTFQKNDDASLLRLTYMDNFRVYNGGTCRWYIRIDDKDCPYKDDKGNTQQGWIASSLHTHANENDHVPQAMAGYCRSVLAGEHTMKVGVNSGGHDCYTGWETSYHLEVVEVYVDGDFNEPEFHRWFYQRHGNVIDARDNGFLNMRHLDFKKGSDDTILRLFYSDNLRVHGHGKWCKWELRVDDKQCHSKVNISGNRYAVSNQNDHMPGLIIGYCKGIKKGQHSLRVHVRGNSADCYTGWDRQSQSHFMMEVEELEADGITVAPGSVGYDP